MGNEISRADAEAYLAKQEALIAKLSAAVSAKQQQQRGGGNGAVAAAAPGGSSDASSSSGTGSGGSDVFAPPVNEFDVASSGKTFAAPESLSDEIYGLVERARNAERRHAEPPVEDYEREAPVEEWVAPTPEQAAALKDSLPWLTVMSRPKGFTYGGVNDAKPNLSLELEHVYGYRSSGIRDNVRYVGDAVDGRRVLFTAGAVAVLHDVATNRQVFFREHTDEITSVAISPDGKLAATGDQGKWPSIFVWDVATQTVRAKLSGHLRRAAVSLSFSHDGALLAGVGLDDEHTLAVYDWRKGKVVGEAAGSRSCRILEVHANRESSTKAQQPFFTIGEQHAVWWGYDSAKASVPREALSPAKLALGRMGDLQTFTTATSTAGFTAIGTQNGELYLCRDAKLLRVVDAHHGPVTAMRLPPNGSVLVTGGYDGYVSLWSIANGFRRIGPSRQVTAAWAPDANGLNTPMTFSRPNSIRGLDFELDPVTKSITTVLVGSVDGSIHELMTHEPLSSSSSWSTSRAILTAHGGDLTTVNVVGELSGLAVHPTKPRFASVGETTLLLWDADTREAVRKVRLPSRGQCVAWGGSGDFVIVGLHSGVFLVFDDKLNFLREIRASLRRVQCARFSKDGSLLAVGTADNVVHLYHVSAESREFTHKGKLSGPQGVILSIDFSEDASLIQCSTQAYELVYFDLSTMAPLSDEASRALGSSGVAWQTNSSILGWDVQGIWPQGSQLNDVCAVSRSSCGTLLATAEETGTVKVFRYPCVGGGISFDGVLRKRPDAVRGLGHGGRVTKVQWLAGDERLVTTGGDDLSCFQWRVVRRP